MTLAQLQAKYKLDGSNLACRPLRRHRIVQDRKQVRDAQGLPVFEPGGAPQMVDKIRLIDDSKASLDNSTLIRCCETIAPCRFTYMGYVADETLLQASALGVGAPELVFSLDDMKSAYRQIPTSDPEMCIICIYSFDKGNLGPQFVEQHGHKYVPAPHAGERLARKPVLPCCVCTPHPLAPSVVLTFSTLPQLRTHVKCLQLLQGPGTHVPSRPAPVRYPSRKLRGRLLLSQLQTPRRRRLWCSGSARNPTPDCRPAPRA